MKGRSRKTWTERERETTQFGALRMAQAAEDRFRDILAGNNSRWEKAEKQDVTKRERE